MRKLGLSATVHVDAEDGLGAPVLPPKVIVRRELRGDRNHVAFDWRYIFGCGDDVMPARHVPRYTLREPFKVAIAANRAVCHDVFTRYEAAVNVWGYSLLDLITHADGILDALIPP